MNNNLIAVIIGLCCTIIGALLVSVTIDIVKKKVEEVIIKIDALKYWILDRLITVQGDYQAILNHHALAIEALEALGKDNAVIHNQIEKITDILYSMNADLNRYGDILDSVSKENNMLVAEVRSWATPTGCDGDACDINFEEDNCDE